MSTLSVSIITLVSILILIGLRVPIGVAIGCVPLSGSGCCQSGRGVERAARHPVRLRRQLGPFSDPDVPVMGSIANNSASVLLVSCRARVVRRNARRSCRATNMACAGFAAACGSSVAAAAAMARLAIPEI